VKTDSHLENILEKGIFAVTAECGPPRGTEIEVIRKKGELLKGSVDAVNVTDNQTAMVRMSSIASCIILKEIGLETVIQMVTRDRNRIAIQSDLLGAAALGLNNILCLSGDHQKFGDHPSSKNVYDIDSIQLIMTVKKMRDEGKFISGEDIKGRVNLYIGAAANPFADPFELRVIRLAKKINAGADFIQTQCIYNINKFKEWMKKVVEKGLHKRVKIIAGVTPLKSFGMAKYMKENVPGMDIPEEILLRIKGAPKGKASQEGINISIETINELKNIPGVAGVHIMAIEWEEKVREIVERSGLYPRPVKSEK
jgi:methylenetetrahydrofolate reductase (NADPH)